MSLALHALAGDVGDSNIHEGRIQRHKSERAGKQVLRTGCWEDRFAFVVQTCAAKPETVLYSYVAGGLPNNPEHGYPLLFRGLSLPLADRIFALVLTISLC